MIDKEPRDAADNWALKFAGAIIGVGAIIAAIITALSLTYLPHVWGSDDIPMLDPETATDAELVDAAAARRAAENDVRDTGLKIAAGVGAITAALVAYGRLELSRAEHRRAERGQGNERFTKAVEHLGSESIEVRLGGVYALDQFFRDVPEERQRTTNVLAAFVRSKPPATQATARRA